MLEKISSKYIKDFLFKYLKNKRKLNIIKHNKKLIAKLEITKEDFKQYEILKSFKEKYKINIEDIDIIELKLNNKNICDEGIKNLVSLSLKELNNLEIANNKISDIKLLKKASFKELIKLNLSSNKISDIKILEKVNFKNLKELNLSHNLISNINILEKVDFKELLKLDLSNNKISDINILEKVKV